MIYIVGVGPGDKKYLTLEALNVVNNADIIVGSKRSLNLFDINNKEKEIYELTKNLIEELNNIVNKYNQNKNIVLLSTGDPCFSGLLKTLLRNNIANKEDIEVVPGISSIQIASSKLKISWEDYHILTLHGKEKNRKILLDLIKNNEKVIFLPSNLKEDVRYLINNGINPEKRIWVCENLTYGNEKIINDNLSNILNRNFSYLCVCIID